MYNLTYRRSFFPFKCVLRNVAFHSHTPSTDKLWVHFATGGAREVVRWKECQMELGADWKENATAEPEEPKLTAAATVSNTPGTYALTFRRWYSPFKKTIKGVRAHSHQTAMDKLVVYSEAGVVEIRNWTGCEIFLGSDWEAEFDRRDQAAQQTKQNSGFKLALHVSSTQD